MNTDNSTRIGLTGLVMTPATGALVYATQGRGLNPHEIGHMLLDKVFYIGADVPPAVREQAVAYRNQLYAAFVHYLTMAQKSQNTTIFNALQDAGEQRAAEIVRKL